MTQGVGFSRFSKSRFMAGRQCKKRLYFEVHNPDLAGITEECDNATLNTRSGSACPCERYSRGRLIDHENLDRVETEHAARTAPGDPSIRAIYEAGAAFPF
jgi:hypothetical protein